MDTNTSYYDLIINFFQEIGEEDSIVFQKTIESSEGIYSELVPPLPWRLQEILNRGNLTSLYSHQVEAIEEVRKGNNVLIITKTASGKSLCYNLPVIEDIMSNTNIKALYIFPTKALAQNQASRLEKYNLAFYYDDFHVGIYDGDTPEQARKEIRKKVNILITTPEMLHIGILPNHNKWKKFFTNLKYIILDELHMYRGIFGSHMAMIIRRLRRICNKYGSNPQFICSSATIANPGELANNITQLDFKIIEKSGSPSGEKTFIFWDPSLSNEKGLKRSINIQASLLLYHLIVSNIRTILFTQTRVGAEIILKTARDLLSGNHYDLVDKINSYRAGYTSELRRKIEKQLSTGELLGVITTSALEVGVDIGSLDVCVIVGFPKSIMSVWQQAGRAGRRNRPAIIILLASETPGDHYYLKNGEDFFTASYETAVIDLYNPYILDGHLKCAAYEFPIKRNDEIYFGKTMIPFIRAYSEKNYLFYKDNEFHWNIDDYYPAQEISLRCFSGDIYDIVNYAPPYNIIGNINAKNVQFHFHRNAIYVHQGEVLKVINLDEKNKKIFVTPNQVEYYTKPQLRSEVEPLKKIRKHNLVEELFFGYLKITEKCLSYREIDLATGKYIKTQPLMAEPDFLETKGFWFTISEKIQKILRNSQLELSGGLHGAGHLLTSMLPVITMSEGGDTGSIASPLHQSTNKPTIFIYDRFPGGLGYSEKGFDFFPDLIKKSCKIIKECRCNNGCPRCIYTSNTAYPEQYLNKKASIIILEELYKEMNLS